MPEISSVDKQSYRQTLKSTVLFGGVQIVSILAGVIRTKLLAIFTGTVGVGIFGIFTSVLQAIVSIVCLGLNVSSVKEISESNGKNIFQFSRTIIILRRWVLFTGVVGMLGTILLSPWLSKWSFENYDYIISFVLLSVVVLLQIINYFQLAILQGTRNLLFLAKTSIAGSLGGIVVSIPLYILFGIQGIIPSMIGAVSCSLYASWIFLRQIKTCDIKLSLRDTFNEGFIMAKLGSSLMLTNIMLSLRVYLTQIFITNQDGLNALGIYQSGSIIINSYIGILLTSMITDLYPRLSLINKDNLKLENEINKQMEISLIILLPILLILIIFMPLIIEILYTKEFLVAQYFLRWALISNIFKILSLALSYIVIAKGNSKIQSINTVFINIILLIFDFSGYYFYGFTGLGVAMIIGWGCAVLYQFLIIKHMYKIMLSNNMIKIMLVAFLLSIFASISGLCDNIILKIMFSWLILFTGICFFYVELNKRIELDMIVNKLKNIIVKLLFIRKYNK